MSEKNKGITNLAMLIRDMEPVLNEGEYVFVTVSDPTIIARNVPICEFKEKEGTTLILSKADALRFGLTFDYVASWITLNVHSSLEAVGLTAAFSTALAENGISCNVVAGYYHDHIFVDQSQGEKALSALKGLGEASEYL